MRTPGMQQIAGAVKRTLRSITDSVTNTLVNEIEAPVLDLINQTVVLLKAEQAQVTDALMESSRVLLEDVLVVCRAACASCPPPPCPRRFGTDFGGCHGLQTPRGAANHPSGANPSILWYWAGAIERAVV